MAAGQAEPEDKGKDTRGQMEDTGRTHTHTQSHKQQKRLVEKYIHPCALALPRKGNREIQNLQGAQIFGEGGRNETEQTFLSSQLAPFCPESRQLSQPDAAKQLIIVI